MNCINPLLAHTGPIRVAQGKQIIEASNLRNFCFPIIFYDDKIMYLHKNIPKVDKILENVNSIHTGVQRWDQV